MSENRTSLIRHSPQTKYIPPVATHARRTLRKCQRERELTAAGRSALLHSDQYKGMTTSIVIGPEEPVCFLYCPSPAWTIHRLLNHSDIDLQAILRRLQSTKYVVRCGPVSWIARPVYPTTHLVSAKHDIAAKLVGVALDCPARQVPSKQPLGVVPESARPPDRCRRSSF